MEKSPYKQQIKNNSLLKTSLSSPNLNEIKNSMIFFESTFTFSRFTVSSNFQRKI